MKVAHNPLMWATGVKKKEPTMENEIDCTAPDLEDALLAYWSSPLLTEQEDKGRKAFQAM